MKQFRCLDNQRTPMRAIAALTLIFVFPLLFSSPLGGQESSDSGDEVQLGTALAGVQRFAKGRWASLSVVGTNRSDQEAHQSVTAYVGDSPQMQFSTKLWVPAGAKRQSWMPIRVPSSDQIDGDRAELNIMKIQQTDAGEQFEKNYVGMPVSSRSLMLTDDEINTGVIRDPADLEVSSLDEQQDGWVDQVIYAGRDSAVQSQLELPYIGFNANFLPPTYYALQELDQLVITGDLLLTDTTGMAAVRQWLRSGGRVWIMLDRTSMTVVDELLGDQVGFSIVDRIEVNECEILTRDPIGGYERGLRENWTSEQPADFVRVVGNIGESACRINESPAAFYYSVGEGEVLFTTLGPRGWLHGRDRPTTALKMLSKRFFEPRNEPTDFASSMHDVVDNQIGYRIPSRALAGTVLALNALVIFIGGIIWARQRRLERMAFLIPACAVVSTVTMLFIGTYHTRMIPSTVATGQVVQVRATTNEVDLTTLHATYSQQKQQLGVRSPRGLMATPLNLDAGSETIRVQVDDGGTSRWFGPDQSPGMVRHLVSRSTGVLDEPIFVRGTFEADGFQGKLYGLDLDQCGDAVIVASPAPPSAATIDRERDTIESSSAALLKDGEYFAGALLSDKQRHRQSFLQETLATRENNPLANQLSLLVWSQPLDLSTQFSEQFTRVGDALFAIPIDIVRPAIGVDFEIPATFIEIESYSAERGVSSIYLPRSGQWLTDVTKATDTPLLFRFPDAISDVSLQRAKLTLKINAPDREFIVNGMVDGQPTELFRKRDATGELEIEIDRKDALQLHHDGGLWLEVVVTESENVEKIKSAASGIQTTRVKDETTWQIDYLYLSAVGRIESES